LRHLHHRCEALHGHNWKIEVTVGASRLTKEGVVLDFGVLKEKVEQILSLLDHTYLNELPCFLRREPSSENIARYIFDRLRAELLRVPVTVKRVTAWESERTYATYGGRRG
jgi:6-pyruvoyltetrahydropterin/6-carboxytetrahydropterin synthase